MYENVDGKEGVDGSSPSEGFRDWPAYGPVSDPMRSPMPFALEVWGQVLGTSAVAADRVLRAYRESSAGAVQTWP
jgi:hypothetical protein